MYGNDPPQPNPSMSSHVYEIQRFLNRKEREQDQNTCGFKHVGYVNHPFSSEEEAVNFYNDHK